MIGGAISRRSPPRSEKNVDFKACNLIAQIFVIVLFFPFYVNLCYFSSLCNFTIFFSTVFRVSRNWNLVLMKSIVGQSLRIQQKLVNLPDILHIEILVEMLFFWKTVVRLSHQLVRKNCLRMPRRAIMGWVYQEILQPICKWLIWCLHVCAIFQFQVSS